MPKPLRRGLLFLAIAAGVILGLDVAFGWPDQAGKRYAFLVGVDKYDKRGFPDLSYAERDVTELAKLLRAGGYEIIVLTGSAAKEDDQATKAVIERRLKQLLAKVTKKDLVLLAFTGHGEQVEVKDKSQPFFCPRDAVSGEPSSLVAINDVMTMLDKGGGGQNIVLIDACRNDPAPGRGRGIDGNRAETLAEGTAIMFSCSRGQRSFETKNAGGGHGVFFHYVLEGLRGGAADKGGKVDWDSLAKYVRENVDDHLDELMPKSERGNLAQTPHKVENFIGRAPVLLTKKLDGGQKPDDRVVADKAIASKTLPSLKLLHIPAKGKTFTMGSPEGEKDRSKDETAHEVTLTADYYLGVTTVTRGQFAAFVKADGYETEAEKGDGGNGWDDNKKDWFKDKKYSWRNLGFTQTDEHPVVNVSWNDALAFCAWLKRKDDRDYRLPTEAQWEYACRAGTRTRYSFGDDEEDLAKHANVADANFREATKKDWGIKASDGYAFTAPVGLFQKNSFGLYDMHGNVWQWCADWYGDYPKDAVTDPQGPKEGSNRVVRGGGWSDDPRVCRSANRGRIVPWGRSISVGFRLAVPVR